MARGERAIERLKSYLREHPAPLETITTSAEMWKANPRTSAILAVIRIENYLELALINHLRPLNNTDLRRLFDSGKPLATFSAKIDMAYSLSLFGRRMRDDLHMIREIRNAFAHSGRTLDFMVTAIADVCACLTPLDFYNTNFSTDDPFLHFVSLTEEITMAIGGIAFNSPYEDWGTD